MMDKLAVSARTGACDVHTLSLETGKRACAGLGAAARSAAKTSGAYPQMRSPASPQMALRFPLARASGLRCARLASHSVLS